MKQRLEKWAAERNKLISNYQDEITSYDIERLLEILSE